MQYSVTTNNIHITDSYLITKRETMVAYLQDIKCLYPDCLVFNRTWKSLTREWVAHNRLYMLGLWKSRTKDVDLDYPQKWYIKILYFIIGI